MPAIKPSEKGENNIVSVVKVGSGQELVLILAVEHNAAVGRVSVDDFSTPGPDVEDTFLPMHFSGEHGRVERVLPLAPGNQHGLVAAIGAPPGRSNLMLKLERNGVEVYRRYGEVTGGNKPHRLLMSVNLVVGQ